MDKHDLDEILTYFADERLVFPYFKDRYALMLLADHVGEGMAMQAIKQSKLHGLLNKQPVKLAVKNSGDGVLRSMQLDAVWPQQPLQFVLTLGQWSGGLRSWGQTSRKGHNLVLQLNFSGFEDGLMQRWIRPKSPEHKPFQYYGHPISEQRNTLAWARIDLDLARGEALIEEVQTDWVRRVRSSYRRMRGIPQGQKRTEWVNNWCDGSSQSVEAYCEFILNNHAKLWDEAMLMAAISFLRHEVGIGRIFYHTWKSGLLLKNLDERWGAPPKSLYTKLPRRFCFDTTDALPSHMADDMLRSRHVRRALKTQTLEMFVLA